MSALKTLQGTSESTSQGRPLNVRLGHILDVISGRPQDARLGLTQDVKLGRPRDGQLGSLGDVLGTLEGMSWGPIFAGWALLFITTRYLLPTPAVRQELGVVYYTFLVWMFLSIWKYCSFMYLWFQHKYQKVNMQVLNSKISKLKHLSYLNFKQNLKPSNNVIFRRCQMLLYPNNQNSNDSKHLYDT